MTWGETASVNVKYMKNDDKKVDVSPSRPLICSACRDYHETIKQAQEAVKKFPIPHQIYTYESDLMPRILPIDFYDENEVNEIPLCVVFTEFSDYPRNAERLR